jgi:hypothetical protein
MWCTAQLGHLRQGPLCLTESGHLRCPAAQDYSPEHVALGDESAAPVVTNMWQSADIRCSSDLLLFRTGLVLKHVALGDEQQRDSILLWSFAASLTCC